MLPSSSSPPSSHSDSEGEQGECMIEIIRVPQVPIVPYDTLPSWPGTPEAIRQQQMYYGEPDDIPEEGHISQGVIHPNRTEMYCHARDLMRVPQVTIDDIKDLPSLSSLHSLQSTPRTPSTSIISSALSTSIAPGILILPQRTSGMQRTLGLPKMPRKVTDADEDSNTENRCITKCKDIVFTFCEEIMPRIVLASVCALLIWGTMEAGHLTLYSREKIDGKKVDGRYSSIKKDQSIAVYDFTSDVILAEFIPTRTEENWFLFHATGRPKFIDGKLSGLCLYKEREGPNGKGFLNVFYPKMNAYQYSHRLPAQIPQNFPVCIQDKGVNTWEALGTIILFILAFIVVFASSFYILSPCCDWFYNWSLKFSS